MSTVKSNTKLSIKPMLKFHKTLLRRPESRLIIWVLMLGLIALSTVQLLTLRLDRALVLEATRWVGADLVIATTQAIAPHWQDQALKKGMQYSITTEFPSVVYTDTHMQLAAVKAVQKNYPLKGEIKTSLQPLADPEQWQTHNSGPPVGEVWVDQRILAALDIRVGQTLTLGNKPLTVSAIVQYEPDRHTNFLSLSPRVLMHEADLAATGVIQPGSRMNYKLLLTKGSAANNLKAYQEWISTELRPGDKIVTALDERPTLSRASDRLKRFLNTSLWLTLSMTLCAVALATQHLSHQIFPSFQTLYLLGMTPRRITVWYLSGLLMVGLIAMVLGVSLGVMIQAVGARAFALRLPPTIEALSPIVLASWVNLAIGIPLAMGMIRFSKLLKALVQGKEKTPSFTTLSLIKNGYCLSTLALIITLLMSTVSNWKTGVLIILGLAIALIVLYAVFQSLIKLSQKLSLGSASRYALLNLSRLPHLYFFQLLAFVMAIVSGSIAWNMGGELLGQWQNQLPEGTPNIFTINLLPKDQQAFENMLSEHQVPPSTLYPIVRGRLTAINETPLQQAATKEEDTRSQVNALRRDLNFTWLKHPPQKNTLASGNWWPPRTVSDSAPFEVSVEKKIAQRLAIELGDQISVTIGTQTVSARVTSLRDVTWESFEPNFYFIFEPRALANMNHTFMSSFFLKPEQSELLPKLANTFTSITFFDVKALLAEGDRLLANLSLAVWIFGGITALIGLGILTICHQQRQALWQQQGAILFALGADTDWQKSVLRAETRLLWALSLTMGLATTELIRFILNVNMQSFHLPAAWLPALGVTCLLMGLWAVLSQAAFNYSRHKPLEAWLR